VERARTLATMLAREHVLRWLRQAALGAGSRTALTSPRPSLPPKKDASAYRAINSTGTLRPALPSKTDRMCRCCCCCCDYDYDRR
jgi:hypothetical protein